MGAFCLAMHHVGLNFSETCLLEHLGEFCLGKAQPDIGIKFAGLLEVVAEEIQDGDATARLQDRVGGLEGAQWMASVVQGLAEDGQIDATWVERWVFEVAEAILKIGEAVFLGEFSPVGDHLFGVIDGIDLGSTLGEELGQGALAGPQICDDEGRQELDEGLAEGLPGATGDVVTAKFSRQGVKVCLSGLGTLAQDDTERGGVRPRFPQFAGSGFKQGQEVFVGLAFLCGGFFQAVEPVFAGTTVLDEACGL